MDFLVGSAFRHILLSVENIVRLKGVLRLNAYQKQKYCAFKLVPGALQEFIVHFLNSLRTKTHKKNNPKAVIPITGHTPTSLTALTSKTEV